MTNPESQSPKQSSTISKPILYIGLLGWAAFAYTSYQSNQKNKVFSSKLSSEKSRVSALILEATETDKQLENISKGNVQSKLQIEAKDQQLLAVNQQLAELTKKYEQALSSHQIAESEHANESSTLLSQISAQKNAAQNFLKEIHHKYASQPASEPHLQDWSSFLKKYPSKDMKFDESIHSQIAERYYTLELFAKTKEHLELSNHFNPELEQRILGNLDIDLAFAEIETAIKEKKDKATISEQLKQAS